MIPVAKQHQPRSVVFLRVSRMPVHPWPERLKVAAWVLVALVLAGLGGRLDVSDPETVRPRPVVVTR